MTEASQGMKTGDISDARDSEDEEVRYNSYCQVLWSHKNLPLPIKPQILM